MSGDVRVHQESVAWVSLRRDQNLSPGDTIWTGRNGRVMISSEDGHVLLKPRSMIKIPKQKLRSNINVILHGFGTLEAVVEKRKNHHFSVQSNYLAAVVKGTKFSVSGDDQQSRLDVEEGIVEAIDLSTGQTTNVSAGQFLTVMKRANADVENDGTAATKGQPTAPKSGMSGNGKGNKGVGVGNGGGNGTGSEGIGNGNGNGGGNGLGGGNR